MNPKKSKKVAGIDQRANDIEVQIKGLSLSLSLSHTHTHRVESRERKEGVSVCPAEVPCSSPACKCSSPKMLVYWRSILFLDPRSRPSLRAWTHASRATRLATALGAFPLGCPKVLCLILASWTKFLALGCIWIKDLARGDGWRKKKIKWKD